MSQYTSTMHKKNKNNHSLIGRDSLFLDKYSIYKAKYWLSKQLVQPSTYNDANENQPKQIVMASYQGSTDPMKNIKNSIKSSSNDNNSKNQIGKSSSNLNNQIQVKGSNVWQSSKARKANSPENKILSNKDFGMMSGNDNGLINTILTMNTNNKAINTNTNISANNQSNIMNVSAINITKSQQIDGSPDMVSSSILPKANKQLLMNTIFPSQTDRLQTVLRCLVYVMEVLAMISILIITNSQIQVALSLIPQISPNRELDVPNSYWHLISQEDIVSRNQINRLVISLILAFRIISSIFYVLLPKMRRIQHYLLNKLIQLTSLVLFRIPLLAIPSTNSTQAQAYQMIEQTLGYLPILFFCTCLIQYMADIVYILCRQQRSGYFDSRLSYSQYVMRVSMIWAYIILYNIMELNIYLFDTLKFYHINQDANLRNLTLVNKQVAQQILMLIFGLGCVLYNCYCIGKDSIYSLLSRNLILTIWLLVLVDYFYLLVQNFILYLKLTNLNEQIKKDTSKTLQKHGHTITYLILLTFNIMLTVFVWRFRYMIGTWSVSFKFGFRWNTSRRIKIGTHKFRSEQDTNDDDYKYFNQGKDSYSFNFSINSTFTILESDFNALQSKQQMVQYLWAGVRLISLGYEYYQFIENTITQVNWALNKYCHDLQCQSVLTHSKRRYDTGTTNLSSYNSLRQYKRGLYIEFYNRFSHHCYSLMLRHFKQSQQIKYLLIFFFNHKSAEKMLLYLNRQSFYDIRQYERIKRQHRSTDLAAKINQMQNNEVHVNIIVRDYIKKLKKLIQIIYDSSTGISLETCKLLGEQIIRYQDKILKFGKVSTQMEPNLEEDDQNSRNQSKINFINGSQHIKLQKNPRILSQYSRNLLNLIRTEMLGVSQLTKNYSRFSQDQRIISQIINQEQSLFLISAEVESVGKIVAINPSASKLTCYSQEQLIGKNLNTILPEQIHMAHSKLLSNSAQIEKSTEKDYVLKNLIYIVKKNKYCSLCFLSVRFIDGTMGKRWLAKLKQVDNFTPFIICDEQNNIIGFNQPSNRIGINFNWLSVKFSNQFVRGLKNNEQNQGPQAFSTNTYRKAKPIVLTYEELIKFSNYQQKILYRTNHIISSKSAINMPQTKSKNLINKLTQEKSNILSGQNANKQIVDNSSIKLIQQAKINQILKIDTIEKEVLEEKSKKMLSSSQIIGNLQNILQCSLICMTNKLANMQILGYYIVRIVNLSQNTPKTLFHKPIRKLDHKPSKLNESKMLNSSHSKNKKLYSSDNSGSNNYKGTKSKKNHSSIAFRTQIDQIAQQGVQSDFRFSYNLAKNILTGINQQGKRNRIDSQCFQFQLSNLAQLKEQSSMNSKDSYRGQLNQSRNYKVQQQSQIQYQEQQQFLKNDNQNLQASQKDENQDYSIQDQKPNQSSDAGKNEKRKLSRFAIDQYQKNEQKDKSIEHKSEKGNKNKKEIHDRKKLKVKHYEDINELIYINGQLQFRQNKRLEQRHQCQTHPLHVYHQSQAQYTQQQVKQRKIQSKDKIYEIIQAGRPDTSKQNQSQYELQISKQKRYGNEQKFSRQHKALLIIIALFVLTIVVVSIIQVIFVNSLLRQHNNSINSLLLLGDKNLYYSQLANTFNQHMVINLNRLISLAKHQDFDSDDITNWNIKDILGSPSNWFQLTKNIEVKNQELGAIDNQQSLWVRRNFKDQLPMLQGQNLVNLTNKLLIRLQNLQSIYQKYQNVPIKLSSHNFTITGKINQVSILEIPNQITYSIQKILNSIIKQIFPLSIRLMELCRETYSWSRQQTFRTLYITISVFGVLTLILGIITVVMINQIKTRYQKNMEIFSFFPVEYLEDYKQKLMKLESKLDKQMDITSQMGMEQFNNLGTEQNIGWGKNMDQSTNIRNQLLQNGCISNLLFHKKKINRVNAGRLKCFTLLPFLTFLLISVIVASFYWVIIQETRDIQKLENWYQLVNKRIIQYNYDWQQKIMKQGIINLPYVNKNYRKITITEKTLQGSNRSIQIKLNSTGVSEGQLLEYVQVDKKIFIGKTNYIDRYIKNLQHIQLMQLSQQFRTQISQLDSKFCEVDQYGYKNASIDVGQFVKCQNNIGGITIKNLEAYLQIKQYSLSALFDLSLFKSNHQIFETVCKLYDNHSSRLNEQYIFNTNKKIIQKQLSRKISAVHTNLYMGVSSIAVVMVVFTIAYVWVLYKAKGYVMRPILILTRCFPLVVLNHNQSFLDWFHRMKNEEFR